MDITTTKSPQQHRQAQKEERQSFLEVLQGHTFALLYDISDNLKTSFAETMIIELTFSFESLLILFAPWVLPVLTYPR